MSKHDAEIRSKVILATDYRPGSNYWLSLFIGDTDEIRVPDWCDGWFCNNRPTVLHKDYGFLCARHMAEFVTYTVPTEHQFYLSH